MTARAFGKLWLQQDRGFWKWKIRRWMFESFDYVAEKKSWAIYCLCHVFWDFIDGLFGWNFHNNRTTVDAKFCYGEVRTEACNIRQKKAQIQFLTKRKHICCQLQSQPVNNSEDIVTGYCKNEGKTVNNLMDKKTEQFIWNWWYLGNLLMLFKDLD